MPPQAGQKRAAASNGESSGSQGGRTKKTRFVEPSEDPANFAEEVESALETKNRKGRVKNEGYDSDSSDDGEGVVLSRKNKAEDDEDEDMFAMGDKDEKKDETSAKKKKAEYLRLGDIEGQEFGGSGSDAESSDEEEPEDEDEAERRKKAGMGYELSSFNMREEMEEGKFTEDGSYVRSFDPHGVHDRWMEGVDEREIKKARRRKRHMEKIQKERIKAEEQELEHSGGGPCYGEGSFALPQERRDCPRGFAALGSTSEEVKAKVRRLPNPWYPCESQHTTVLNPRQPRMMPCTSTRSLPHLLTLSSSPISHRTS